MLKLTQGSNGKDARRCSINGWPDRDRCPHGGTCLSSKYDFDRTQPPNATMARTDSSPIAAPASRTLTDDNTNLHNRVNNTERRAGGSTTEPTRFRLRSLLHLSPCNYFRTASSSCRISRSLRSVYGRSGTLCRHNIETVMLWLTRFTIHFD